MRAHLTLYIDSLAHGGAGVARDAGGRIVFVRGACPGDEVEAVVVAEHKRYAEADIARVLSPGPARVTPPCPYFGLCGGCQWQLISVDAQREAKRAIVSDSLERIGRIAGPDVRETVGADDGYGYRNKIELNVSVDERGRLVLGMREAGTERTVPIDACLLLPGKARSLPRALTDALLGLSKGGNPGLLRVVARAASNGTDIEIDLWRSLPCEMPASSHLLSPCHGPRHLCWPQPLSRRTSLSAPISPGCNSRKTRAASSRITASRKTS